MTCTIFQTKLRKCYGYVLLVLNKKKDSYYSKDLFFKFYSCQNPRDDDRTTNSVKRNEL